jgi:hypothetical protein
MEQLEPKTKFGLKSLNMPTPRWSRVVFGVCLLVTTTMAGWVAGTQYISDGQKFEWILILKCIDPFIFGLSKLFGVELTRPDPPQE